MTRRLALASVLLFLAVLSPTARAANAPPLRANRIILRVTDLKTSIAFYRDQVALPLQSTFDEFAVFGSDGMALMLQQIERKSTGPSTGLSALTEIVLESADVMTAYREMEARGVSFLREPFAATTDGSRVLYSATFKDPDGHILSVTGWVGSR